MIIRRKRNRQWENEYTVPFSGINDNEDVDNFNDDIEENQRNRDLVDSVIYMGHIMNCEVISEGVETENQLKLLNEHNCDFVQGYVWGKPMAYDDAIALSKTI